MKNGLEKAYSSSLKMDQRDHGRVVVKTVDAKERKNETFFHKKMSEMGLPSMSIHEEGDAIVLDFIENAETLGDNETADNYRLFGEAVRKMHAVKFNHPFYIDQEGKHNEIFWGTFIEHCLIEGSDRQNKNSNGLEKNIVDRITAAINPSGIGDTDRSVLIHGDLHANNALIKDQNIILFDKGDQIVAGDPMYDLALVAINLPGAIYKLGTQIEKDIKLLKAFIEGYGIDFTPDTQKLEAYILLRALERWPNPFEKEIPDIINAILGNDQ